LSELEEYATKLFSPIPKSTTITQQEVGDIFPESLSKKLIAIKSLKDHKMMNITWQVPFDLACCMDTKPGDILSHVIGNESPGSLLSHLKSLGLVTSLSAGLF
jgi:insulysin